MGGIKTKMPLKYVILYGPSGVGKTFMLYSTQARFNNVLTNLSPTEGINYEEIKLSKAKVTLGVFDISGDLKQYNLVNIVLKSVRVEGIIFLIPLEKMEQISEYKAELLRVLNNKYLDDDNLALLVIYNIKTEMKEKLGWIDKSVLDNKLNLKNLIENNFPNVVFDSKIADVNSVVIDDTEMQDILTEYCENFGDD